MTTLHVDTPAVAPDGRLAVMQPYLFPYIGYFHLIQASDLFVFYDDVQFIKGGWINRNRILLEGQPRLFTVPLVDASPNRLINETRHVADSRWLDAFSRQLRHAYHRAPQFAAVHDLVADVVSGPRDSIADLAIDSITAVYDYLGLPFSACRSSQAAPETRGLSRADRLIAMTKKFGYERYVNAPGGVELYDPRYFTQRGVALSFLRSSPTDYQRIHGQPPVPSLSIIDVLMFNTVERTKELLAAFTVIGAGSADRGPQA